MLRYTAHRYPADGVANPGSGPLCQDAGMPVTIPDSIASVTALPSDG
jgi:hypothetical protein